MKMLNQNGPFRPLLKKYAFLFGDRIVKYRSIAVVMFATTEELSTRDSGDQAK